MVRKVLFIFFFVILCIPLLELQLNVVDEEPLKGAYHKVKDVNFTWETWFGGDYQIEKELYLKNIIGFKPVLTRINNQLDFSLFNVTHARGITAGENDILYQDMYVDAFYGRDYVGYDSLEKRVSNYKKLQDQLAERGTDIYLVIAPGKASMFPESIPAQLKSEKDTTNYEVAINLLQKYDCKYLNLRDYFVNIKDTSSHPLFPNHGIHWSGYGITVATDSLVQFLETESDVKLRSYSNNQGSYSTDYRFTDNDIGQALNLLLRNTNQELYYPNVAFRDTDTNKDRPNMLAIGDSFTQSFWRFYPYFDTLFSPESRFFYYNKHIGWPKQYAGIKVVDMDFYEQISDRDIILIVSTEQNLKQFGFGFVEMALGIINNSEEMAKAKLTYFINEIRQNADSMIVINSKASKLNVSIDSMIFLEARDYTYNYLVDFYLNDFFDSDSVANFEEDNRYNLALIKAKAKADSWVVGLDPNKYLLDEELRSTMIRIKSIPTWYEKIIDKAHKNNVSAEHQLMIEARWVINQKKNSS